MQPQKVAALKEILGSPFDFNCQNCIPGGFNNPKNFSIFYKDDFKGTSYGKRRLIVALLRNAL
jgi:hypothetical protein